MTNSLSRLLGLPFALILIYCFTSGGLADFGIKTFLVLISIVALMLLYIFNRQVDIFWWKKRGLTLDAPLISWMDRFAPSYAELSDEQKENIQGRIALFMKVKNFTLKGKRDYQLEEDVKLIIAHEFMRITLAQDPFYFPDYEQFVVYNHPFATPKIETLHAVEIYDEDGVVIFSKEQLVNGFVDPNHHINVALLAAVMLFIAVHPRLQYPVVHDLEAQEIVDAHGLDLDHIHHVTALRNINNLDLMLFCFFQFPRKNAEAFPERNKQLASLFA